MGFRDPKTGRMNNIDPIDYLYANISIDEESDCWNWIGRTFKSDYGEFKCAAIKKGNINASRASWIIHNGPILSRRVFVCHHCDNRRCVNPDHLFLGNHKINMEDCKAKDRMNKGEDRPQAKLTESDVRSIRRLRQEGESWRRLAARFGVHPHCIVSAATGVTWAHVDEPIPTYVGRPGRPSAA